jgi:type I restriction enzyme S subunit
MTNVLLNLPPLPVGWRWSALEDFLGEDGLSYGIVQPGERTSSGVPVLRVNDLRNGRVTTEDVMRVDPRVEASYSRSRLRGGEILLTLVGSVGQVAVAPDNLAGWNVARAVAVIRPAVGVSAQWLKLCLQAGAAQHCMQIWQTTTVQATLNLRDVRRLPIPVPPRDEQEAICEVLGALDDKIDLNQGIGRKANNLAFALFAATFERLDYQSIRLGDLADVVDCLHSRKPELVVDSGYRYLVLSDIRDDGRLEARPNFSISAADYREWTRRIEVREGDCVITNVGRVGVSAQIPNSVKAAVGRNMTAIRGRKACPSGYLAEALRCSSVRREIVAKTDEGTVLSALNVRTLPDLALPGADTAARLSFHERVHPLHALQDALLEENARLAATWNALLTPLVSGQLRVLEAESLVGDAAI